MVEQGLSNNRLEGLSGICFICTIYCSRIVKCNFRTDRKWKNQNLFEYFGLMQNAPLPKSGQILIPARYSSAFGHLGSCYGYVFTVIFFSTTKSSDSSCVMLSLFLNENNLYFGLFKRTPRLRKPFYR